MKVPHLHRGVGVTLFSAAACLACSGDTTEAPTSSTATAGQGGAGGGGASTSSTSSGAGGTPLATVTFEGQAVAQGIAGPISGIEVCTYDHPELPCDTSGSSGQFSIELPANAETGFTLRGAATAKVLVALVTSEQAIDGWVIGMPDHVATSVFYYEGGATYPDAESGFLEAFAVTGSGYDQEGLAGVTFEVTPSAGVGPVYGDASMQADKTLQSTSSSGIARFAGITPGEVTLALSPETTLCEAVFGGWPTPQTNAVRGPVVAGFETHLAFYCQGP